MCMSGISEGFGKSNLFIKLTHYPTQRCNFLLTEINNRKILIWKVCHVLTKVRGYFLWMSSTAFTWVFCNKSYLFGQAALYQITPLLLPTAGLDGSYYVLLCRVLYSAVSPCPSTCNIAFRISSRHSPHSDRYSDIFSARWGLLRL